MHKADKKWKKKDWLRAQESLIVRIRAIIRKKKIIIAVQSRTLLCKIISRNQLFDVKGFSIKSCIVQLHSKILIAACAISQVSIY